MPRPRTPPETHRKQIAITLPPALIRRAKTVAAITGTPVSRMVEHALKIAIAKAEASFIIRKSNYPRKCF